MTESVTDAGLLSVLIAAIRDSGSAPDVTLLLRFQAEHPDPFIRKHSAVLIHAIENDTIKQG